MKQVISFLLISFVTLHVAFGQTSDSITVVKKGSKITYQYKGENLSPKQLKETLKTNPEAYALYKKSSTLGIPAYSLSFIGGFITGFSLVSLNPVGIGVGLGTIAVAIPIALKADKTKRKSIETFNKATRQK